MKKLISLLGVVLALCCVSASAQAVNNRVITWPVTASAVPIAGYNGYCGTSADTTTWSKTAVKQVLAPATSMPLALADTVTHCAVKVFAAGGLEGPFSNVVSVLAPGAIIIQITSIDIDTFGFNAATGAWDKLSHAHDVQVAQVSP